MLKEKRYSIKTINNNELIFFGEKDKHSFILSINSYKSTDGLPQIRQIDVQTEADLLDIKKLIDEYLFIKTSEE